MSALDHGSAAGAAHGGETIHGHEEWDTNVDYDWDEADDAANALDPSALAGAPAEYGDDLYAGDGDLPGDDGGGVFLHHLGGDGNGAADGSEAHAGAQPLQHPHPHNDRLSNPPSPDVRDLELAQSHRSDAPHAAAGVWGLPARPSTAPYTITQRQPAGQAAAGGVASHARTHDNSDALVLTGGIASAPPGGRFAGSPPPPYSGGRYGGEANGGGGTGSRFQSPRQPYAPRTGYGQQLSFGHQAHQNYQHQQAADTPRKIYINPAFLRKGVYFPFPLPPQLQDLINGPSHVDLDPRALGGLVAGTNVLAPPFVPHSPMQPLSSERFHPYARPQRSGGHASPIGPPSGRFSAPLAAAPLPVPPVPQTPRKTLSVAVADGLGVGTTTMELRELASSVATVSDVRLLGDGSSAEIGFTTSDGALMFKRRYNRHDVNGSRISVSVRT